MPLRRRCVRSAMAALGHDSTYEAGLEATVTSTKRLVQLLAFLPNAALSQQPFLVCSALPEVAATEGHYAPVAGNEAVACQRSSQTSPQPLPSGLVVPPLGQQTPSSPVPMGLSFATNGLLAGRPQPGACPAHDELR